MRLKGFVKHQVRHRGFNRSRFTMSRRLQVERLEERRVLAVFTVTNNDFFGRGGLYTWVSAANSLYGPDTIEFDPAVFTGGADSLIRNVSLFISDELTIDGSSAVDVTLSGDRLGNDIVDSKFITDVTASEAAGRLGDNLRVLDFAAESGDLTLSDVSITGGLVSGDEGYLESTFSGGGIRFQSSGNLTITDSRISGNTANKGGGVFAGPLTPDPYDYYENFQNTGYMYISNSVVEGNTNTAIYSRFGGVTLTDSHLSGNDQVIRSNFAHFNNSTVSNNFGRTTISARGSAIIRDSIVSGNDGGIEGNGVHLYNSTFSGNDGDLYGYLGASINGSTISGNRSGVHTGEGPLRITNSTISGNDGIGFSVGRASYSFIQNSTITDNNGGGSVAAFTNSTISFSFSISNSIVAGNNGSNRPDLYFSAEAHVDLHYSLIGYIGDEPAIPIGQIGTVFNVDPRLGPLTDNGGPTMTHLPLPGSPVINSGDPASVSGTGFDQRGSGFDRVSGGQIDMGAVEVQMAPATACDLDGDGDCDTTDIDALQANVVSGPSAPTVYDLNGDGLVTLADRNEWLRLAAEANIRIGTVYPLGDANLDGVVDISDLNIWNMYKSTTTSDWSRGDFNLDGVVDTSDLDIWNSYKFMTSEPASLEPSQPVAFPALSSELAVEESDDEAKPSRIDLVDRVFQQKVPRVW